MAQYLLQAEQELERVTHIVRQTLAFYRETRAPEEIDVAALVESVVRLYSNKIAGKKITVHRFVENCGPIRGLIGELRQALSNLVVNAIDAVEDSGTITISARPFHLDENEMIEIVVADDGLGIQAQHAERLFEPFFTTKKNVGTGLGLWATKSIVERHGGRIAVSSHAASATPRGATFTIQLPRDSHPAQLGDADPQAGEAHLIQVLYRENGQPECVGSPPGRSILSVACHRRIALRKLRQLCRPRLGRERAHHNQRGHRGKQRRKNRVALRQDRRKCIVP